MAVRGMVEHGGCKSICFCDPNCPQLGFCWRCEERGDAHCAARFSDAWTRQARR